MKTRNLMLMGAAPLAIALALPNAALAQTTAQTGKTASDQPATSDAAAVPPVTQGGDIVVTGSRIQNPNVASISPVTVVTAAEVRNQGTIRVEDLLNSLPQVFASEGSTDSNGASGIATVDLRDLGTVRTLVLINGRRLGAGDPRDPVADLNFIPASLIRRVDVLTGGASATYGSDALAGVVNFVLNTDFEGVQLDAQTSLYNHDNKYSEANYVGALARRGYTPPVGNTADGGAQTLTLTMGSGTSDGRGHVTAYASYRTVNAVTQGDRDFSYCGYTAGSGGSCGGSSTSTTGRFRRTQNIATGTTPIYSPTGSSYTVNPATPGTFSTYLGSRDGFNFNPYNYFQRPDQRYTFGAFAHYDVSDAFKPYLETMFMDDHSRAQIAPSGAFYGTDFQINCNNPELTASQSTAICGANAGTATLQSVYVGRRNVEGGPRTDDLRHTDYRFVIGAKGDLNSAISYDVYGSMYRAILTERYENDFSRVKINRSLNVVTGPNGTPVCASSLPNAQGIVVDASCVPWNIFTPGSVTQAAVNYLQTPGLQSGQSSEYVASGTVSVDFGKMGMQSPFASTGIQAAFGAEYRKEVLTTRHDVEFLTGDLAGQGTPFGVRDVSGTYNVKEGFVEVSVPIAAEKPYVYALSVNGGYRYSDYSIQGHTNTYKIEGEFAPIKQIRFRGGYNRAVRAPNPLELFSSPNVGLFSGQDPCAGPTTAGSDGVKRTQGNAGTTAGYTAAQCARTGVTAGQFGNIDANPAQQYNQQTAGNVSLQPEIADTVTAGLVLSPIRRLTLTGDFYAIKVRKEIGTLGANYIISQCINNNLLCGQINRAPGGSLFTGTGYVANPTLNLGSVFTKGVDVTALYTQPIGAATFSIDVVGTYLDEFRITPLPGGTSNNCEGKFGTLACGTPLPKWRSKVRLTYQMENGIGISGAWRFFSAVQNDQGAANVAPAVARIPTVNYFDLSLSARISSKYTFRVGAQNLLDKTPPVLDTNYTNNGSNVYAQVYDSLGRYIFAGVQLNF